MTDDYCSFNCSIISNISSTGRIVVTHTGFASIYEEEIQLIEGKNYDFVIELPRRNYVYFLRGGFYNNTKFGIFHTGLKC